MGITTVGLDYCNDAALNGGGQISTWYIGLILGPSPTLSPDDTMSSHAGWTESVDYGEATRRTWSKGSSSGGAVPSSGASVFTMSSPVTIAGFFIASSNVKGGAAGTLLATRLFAEGPQSLVAGQPLVVNPSESAQDITV